MQHFDEIIKQLESDLSFDLNHYDETFLQSIIQKRIELLGCQTISNYYAILKSDQREQNQLQSELNICYSEFYRNSLTYAVLEHILLPKLIDFKQHSKSKALRIWSAATATGQEAYTIAIMLQELQKKLQINIPYHIFATDIDPRFIQKAEIGKYKFEEVKNIPFALLEHYFIREEEFFMVKPTLKAHIEFSQFDLLDPAQCCPATSIFGGFDLIFCANVLFYFRIESRKTILDKVRKCLTSNGLIVTSETERDYLINQNLKEVYPHSSIFR